MNYKDFESMVDNRHSFIKSSHTAAIKQMLENAEGSVFPIICRMQMDKMASDSSLHICENIMQELGFNNVCVRRYCEEAPRTGRFNVKPDTHYIQFTIKRNR